LESSIYTTAFVRMGLSGDYGGTWFLTRLVGTAKARELYLLGERYSAQQAQEMGILNQVFPTMDELRAKTMEIAKRLVQGNPATYAYIKENLNLAETQPLEPFIEHEALNMMLARRALMDAAKAADARKPKEEKSA
jgi:2-(1,2-epoxy-1,2-dihydrophenyl)acetyl-CoA isomerase